MLKTTFIKLASLSPIKKLKAKASSGFTLVELSVVILIIGLALGTFATGFNQYLQQKRIDTTSKRTDMVVTKMLEYRDANGRYPCPASLTALRNTPAYGAESCTASAAATCNATTGICTQQSVRTGLSGTDRDIIIGAVPFRTLNIPEDETYDAYGSRVVVAVTQSLTNATSFKETKGGISIVNEKGTDLYTPAASGHFAVISPGKNKRGGYTKDGTLFSACSGTGNENANCDYLNGVSAASFNANPYSETAGTANYFDDTIKFDPGGARQAWRWTTANQSHLVNMKADKVVLGLKESSTSPVNGALNILYNSTNSSVYDGSVNVRGKLKTTEICDNSSGGCFSPTKITSDCPANEYLVGFLGGVPQCKPIYYGCKDKEYMSGTNPDGTPKCELIHYGVCGSAAGQNYYTFPSTNRCEWDDTFQNMKLSGHTWTWDCVGGPGGDKQLGCTAGKKVDAVCGTPGNAPGVKPTSNLCIEGSPSAVSGSDDPYSWTCAGINGGNNATCGTSQPAAITGKCSTTLNACDSGTFEDVADDNTYNNWTCKGRYGGGNDSCKKAITVVENGVCGTTVNSCTKGSLSDTADDNTNYNWTCIGQNGGSTAACNLVKPPVTACTPGP